MILYVCYVIPAPAGLVTGGKLNLILGEIKYPLFCIFFSAQTTSTGAAVPPGELGGVERFFRVESRGSQHGGRVLSQALCLNSAHGETTALRDAATKEDGRAEKS